MEAESFPKCQVGLIHKMNDNVLQFQESEEVSNITSVGGCDDGRHEGARGGGGGGERPEFLLLPRFAPARPAACRSMNSLPRQSTPTDRPRPKGSECSAAAAAEGNFAHAHSLARLSTRPVVCPRVAAPNERRCIVVVTCGACEGARA